MVRGHENLWTFVQRLWHIKMNNISWFLQVLFKNLNVDMKEVKPSKLLENRVRELEGNPDFSNKEPIHAQPAQVASESTTPYVAVVPSLPQQLDLLLDIPAGNNSATTMTTSAIAQVCANTITQYVIVACDRVNGFINS